LKFSIIAYLLQYNLHCFIRAPPDYSYSSLGFQSEGKNYTLFIYETVHNYSVSY